jgi:hypothetical protein
VQILKTPLVVGAVAVLAGFAATPAVAGGSLFGRAYLSTSIEKEGKPYPLWHDRELRVDFDHEGENRDVVRWRASCNFYGAEFEVEDDRIVTGQVSSSAMGCSPERREREDRFFARFFKADPTFVVSQKRLKLNARDVVIKLKQRQGEVAP